MKILLPIALLLVLFLIITTSCQSSTIPEEFDVDRIGVTVTRTPSSGMVNSYHIEVHNATMNDIHGLSVLLGFYPFNSGSEPKHPDLMFYCKPSTAEVTLESGKSAYYSVVVPNELLREDKINFDDIRVHIIGFNSRVDANHRFEKLGSVEDFAPLITQ